MNADRPAQRRRQAAEQAAEWLTLLQSGRLSTTERSDYLEWLRESSVHVAEMLRVSQIDQALAECRSWSRHTEHTDLDQRPVDKLISPAFAQAAARRTSIRLPVVTWLAAAALAGLAVLGFWMSQNRGFTVIRTAEGDRREVTLTDGSTVDVAPSSELRVRMLDEQRLVELTRGQAFFHVAKDAGRPFVVDAGRARVRAVGTAFDVSRSPAGVTVTVVEGRVSVGQAAPATQAAKTPSGAPDDVFLNANEQLSLAPSNASMAIRKVDGASEAAWTRGSFIFDDEALEVVVRRFNTYNSAQIRILDPSLASRHVSGVFRASDPESLIAFVRSMAGETDATQELIRLDPAK